MRSRQNFVRLRKVHQLTFPLGICAGKHLVADYLIKHHGFLPLGLSRTVATPLVGKIGSDIGLSRVDGTPVSDDSKAHSFATVEALLTFVTKKWQQRWVSADIWDEGILECLLRRPFFLLVSIDAPVSLRWKRFKKR